MGGFLKKQEAEACATTLHRTSWALGAIEGNDSAATGLDGVDLTITLGGEVLAPKKAWIRGQGELSAFSCRDVRQDPPPPRRAL